MEKKLKIAHKDEEPIVKTDNLVIDIKMFLNKSYKLRRNVVSRNIELNDVNMDDAMLNSMFIQCKTHIPKASKDLVTAIIFSDFIQDYNPFAEIIEHYNKNYPKQATGHIDAIIKTIETDTPNADIFIKKWIVALIASINYKHSPLMLVLCGGQNTGKTEWFRRLLPTCLLKYYAESKLDAGKDDEILMTKKLIIVDDEMGGKSKAEEKILKRMTSAQVFSVRSPYGRVSEDLQRLAMLGGTSNPLEILNDPTGNRRILPVKVLSIDHKAYNSVNKDLLFFEAWLEYENGYDYNLSNEQIALLKDSSVDFKTSSTEEELLLRYFGLPSEHPQMPEYEMTNSEILSHIQNQSNIKMSQTKLGIILKQIGFDQKHIKIANTTKRVYLVTKLL